MPIDMTQSHAKQSKNDRELVLIAKNAPIWLHQLSEKYDQSIVRLDQIPVEELDWLRSLGINGVWLIGVWERSPASLKIKRLYGNLNLIASAYSIGSYTVAQNLGGEHALEQLKNRAKKSGIELACDMVPNHTGLDSPWLLQHPEWFISSQSSPKQEWSFTSLNIVSDHNIEVRLEDGYYSQSGAAEVFNYLNNESGMRLYIYHGNDGTSMPWNDTAQLNYLNPQVRGTVKHQIISMSKKFRIIRLDAAMTLLRQHFRRLWFPQPGEKKCIPTRERYCMSQAEFDELMPHEFWAEVMEEINRTSPDTLLMAEAFWLMERYFIEDLGIHRVYNSAFMHHLRDENNAALREYYREILHHNPIHLERFINYLTTPDEKTARELFGSTAKYFGACAFMATLPGMPMFGHGQIEGYAEQYGMDVDKPFLRESPDAEFIQEHQRMIAPLLKQRDRFASAENIRQVDFLTVENNSVDENVFVFLNSVGGKFSLILFNNQDRWTRGYVNQSHDITGQFPANGKMIIRSMFKHTGIPFNNGKNLVLTDLRCSKVMERQFEDIQTSGLFFELPPYCFHAFDLACR